MLGSSTRRCRLPRPSRRGACVATSSSTTRSWTAASRRTTSRPAWGFSRRWCRTACDHPPSRTASLHGCTSGLAMRRMLPRQSRSSTSSMASSGPVVGSGARASAAEAFAAPAAGLLTTLASPHSVRQQPHQAQLSSEIAATVQPQTTGHRSCRCCPALRTPLPPPRRLPRCSHPPCTQPARTCHWRQSAASTCPPCRARNMRHRPCPRPRPFRTHAALSPHLLPCSVAAPALLAAPADPPRTRRPRPSVCQHRRMACSNSLGFSAHKCRRHNRPGKPPCPHGPSCAALGSRVPAWAPCRPARRTRACSSR
mmetsp:Transcript_2177/g.6632  ORF Transcript_2177/g.6632 Transcript_2177/m.6632 type:complete len:311 (+) Transcript_2177:1023-1955(+)